jgi:hypothetical protein
LFGVVKKGCTFTSQTTTIMEKYSKTIELNGKSIKVNVEFSYHTTERKTTLQSWTMPVSVIINNICYDKVVNVSCDTTKRNSGLKFTCNKTGLKFNDSHKKVIEHILTLNK